jgi:hypothetical protein
MMLEISFERPDWSARINGAIDAVLAQGYCTRDLAVSGGKVIGTKDFARRVQAQVPVEEKAVQS